MFFIAEHGGKKVVMFFFPRADTPDCTKEAEQFSTIHDEFNTQNTLVIGVSIDKPAKQAKFRTSFIIDSDSKVATIWPKVEVADHAVDVLERLKAL